MADDVSQGLYDKISKQFEQNLTSSEEAGAFFEKIVQGSPSYVDAENYAEAIGDAMASACDKYLSSAALPEGKMHKNIAEKVVKPLAKDEYSHAINAATAVQTAKNTKAGIHLKAQEAKYDSHRVTEVIERLSDTDQYDDIAWMLLDLVAGFPVSVVDNTLKANVDFQGANGYRGRIIRRAGSNCCTWCADLEGEYEYPGAPDDVYRRHDNCKCGVDYDPGDHNGKVQDVWDQNTWRTEEEAEKLEDRKTYGVERTYFKNEKGRSEKIKK